MKLTIRIKYGPNEQTTELEGSPLYVIGRKNANIVLNDKKCSSIHALLFQSPSNTLCLKDSNSSNGTFLNGKKVEAADLNAGDQLKIGDTLITIVACDMGVASTEATNTDSTQAIEMKNLKKGKPQDKLFLEQWPDNLRALPEKKKA